MKGGRTSSLPFMSISIALPPNFVLLTWIFHNNVHLNKINTYFIEVNITIQNQDTSLVKSPILAYAHHGTGGSNILDI